MKQYRYTLEPYKGPGTRYTCPQCGKKKVFVRYIDTQTNEHIGADTGRCNRQQQCGYHMKPKANPKPESRNTKRGNAKHEILHPKQVPNSQLQSPKSNPLTNIFKNSLSNYHHNQLALYMHRVLPYRHMERVLDAYRVGTHNTSTVFWQIDIHGHIRGGKVMTYDAVTGKRIKNRQPAVTWMHSLYRLQGFELRQCLFGEHLLHGNTQPVAVVESEKTALLAAALMPGYIWLATGGINNLNEEHCRVLHGRHVTLFPDAGAYAQWQEQGRYIPNCKLHGILEGRGFAPGSDIADYLLAA